MLPNDLLQSNGGGEGENVIPNAPENQPYFRGTIILINASSNLKEKLKGCPEPKLEL